jgi:hypothetical protein
VVQQGTADSQQGALVYQRQLRVLPVNHVQALRSAHSPDFRDKKSRSTLRPGSGQAFGLEGRAVLLSCLLHGPAPL